MKLSHKLFFNDIIDNFKFYEPLNEAIAIIDKDGNLKEINRAMAYLFCLKRKDALKISFIQLIGTTASQEIGLETVLTLGKKINVREVCSKTLDGEDLNLTIGIIPLWNEKEVLGALISIQNKSEEENLHSKYNDTIRRLKLEVIDKNEAKLNAEKNAKSKSEFLANMSHEIRTPINGVLGSAELLMDSGLNAEQNSLASMLFMSAKSLLTIINDILDFSKIEAGKLQLEMLAIDYQQVVNDAVNLVDNSLKEKGLQLVYNFPTNYPKLIISDPTRLRQVLLNLLSNSIKFTQKGKIEIKVEFIPQDDNHYLLVTKVIDTGIGMKPAQLKNVFESFSQADSSISRNFGGTGLGTTISRNLINLMKGGISAESTYGEGSTFSFKIPVQVSNKKYLKPELVIKQTRNYNKIIILAEDNVINQKVAIKNLERLGITVLLANNGEEAITLALSSNHELILMDLQMPVLDGIKASIQLRAQGYSKPIIPMTANIMSEEKEKTKIAGMIGFISKPFTKRDLISELDKFLKDSH